MMKQTFAEIFATGEGLLPPDPRLFALFKYVTLEIGLAIGAGMFVAGLVGGLTAVASWGSRGFGDLDASRTLRLVIPSVTLMILGAQGHGFIERLLIGSTSLHQVAAEPYPVLVLRV